MSVRGRSRAHERGVTGAGVPFIAADEDVLMAWMDVQRAGDGSDGFLPTDNHEPDEPDALPGAAEAAAAASGLLQGVRRLLPPARDGAAALAFKRLQVRGQASA
jgi:hypothetical protein